MHYRNNSELPPGLREELSKEAQDLYRETFNRNFPAFRERITSDSEELAHEAAWTTIKRTFKFSNGKWVPQEENAG